MRDYRRIVGEANVEHQPVAGNAELQRVGTAVVSDRPELVVFEKIVDRDPPLVLDIVVGAAERGFVEGHRRKPAGIVFNGASPWHQRLSRIATERAWASSPSALASVIAASASARSCSGPHLRIEVRLTKSRTLSPEENRAARAVGST